MGTTKQIYAFWKSKHWMFLVISIAAVKGLSRMKAILLLFFLLGFVLTLALEQFDAPPPAAEFEPLPPTPVACTQPL